MGNLFKILRAETWVMLAGGGVLLVIVLMALIPGDFGEDVATARSGPAQNNHLHRQPQTTTAAGATRTGKAPVNAPAAVGVQWAQPGVQMQTVRQLQPVKVVATEHYQGKVDQVVNRDPGGWGQIHVIINSGTRQQDISLAPEWYLSFQGCKMAPGARVDGEGFRFDKVRPNAPLYARHVTVGGVRCRLRSIDGMALWSDQLR